MELNPSTDILSIQLCRLYRICPPLTRYFPLVLKLNLWISAPLLTLHIHKNVGSVIW